MWDKLLDQSTSNFSAGRSLLLRAGLVLLVPLVRFYFHLTVTGTAHLPTDNKPVLFALNHQSYLDPALFSCALPSRIRRNIWFIAKDKYFNSRFRRWFARSAQVMLISRNMRLRQAIPTMAGILKQGRHLAIFPEGTRTRNGQPGEFKKTFAIIAAATGCPVIPVVILGAFESAETGKKFPRRVPVTITILPPVSTKGLDPAAIAAKVENAICQTVAERNNVEF
ncbi:MAG: 1-acyl-sn-glycerol-3-phosphate acyltransferase [Acidobacteria bacterium]|nr:1-acyl-sn-glycerol-3-phosphate acyltransferase [Acidobacteriota bacterium]